MVDLIRLDGTHGGAVLAFELDNRAYFAASVSDRGDAFFEQFDQRYADLLAAQQTGAEAFYAVVDGDGSVLGRFNLYDIHDGSAVLGYRVARRAAGRGLATDAVEQICRLAVSEHGLVSLRAATTVPNVASQRVLVKAGFVPVGPADPAEVGGRSGTSYRRSLVG